ncbi:MAG: metallophosphoesterase [Clostridia bacterium]|nr:metallophosphoesterase [Clostridia bacterium]
MKKTSKLLSIFLTVCIVVALFSVSIVPTTAASSVIEISTADQLRLIGRDSAYPLSGNYVLTADIDLGDAEWVSIGLSSFTDTAADEFTGTFDGRGHIISNMWTENRTDPENPTYRSISSNMWGFIANFEGNNSYVKNVVFENVRFNLGCTIDKLVYVGTVVGYIERGSSVIENVVVLSGDVICDNFYHQIIVGGITVGHGNESSHIVRNCYNGANLSATAGTRSKYSSYAVVGGILATNSAVNTSKVVVENCFNTGEITVKGKSGYTYLSIAGGIIARAGNSSGSVATSNATLKNNLALHGGFNLTNAVQYVSDYSATSIIYPTDASDAQSYEALTSLVDAGGNPVWVAEDGKYPIPAQFAAYAKDAEVVNFVLIEDVEELAKIGVDADYPAGGYYKLANDIDASTVDWTPITTFTGLLDGNGYTISGLNIGKDAAFVRDYTAYGLIRTLSGDVRNLKLTDLYFNTYNTSSDYSYMGGIAAIVKQGRIYNCHVEGEIINTTNKYNRTGGIAGHASGTWLIQNCFSDVDIIAGYSKAVTGGSLSAAGIMGNAESAGTLSNCVSVGKVDARYPGYVGAIASHYYGLNLPVNIKNCYSNADIDYYATANIKAFNSLDDKYTLVSKYQMLCGALAGKLPESEWTDGATDLMPYLNVFEEPAVSTQTEEDAADAVEQAIRGTLLTNYTTEADITAVAEGCLEKGSLKFAITNFVLTPAIVGTEGNLELTFTVGEATRSVTLSIAALPKLAYTFSTKYVGRADGTITITDTDTLFTGSKYRLYWGDDNGKLAGYDALATLNDFTVNATGDVLTYKTITNTLIPETATKLYLAVEDKLITEYKFESWRILTGGELKYISAHVSDTHVSYNRSEEALVKTYEKMKELGGKFITVSGDATDRGNDTDFKTLAEIAARYSGTSLWITLGNHDILLANRAANLSAQQSLSYVKKHITNFANPNHTLGSEYVVSVPSSDEEDVHTVDYTWAGGSSAVVSQNVSEYILDMDYTMMYGEDMYIFMSAGDALNKSTSTGHDVALTDKQLAWLDKVLNNYYNVEKKNGQAYFIFHFATLEAGIGNATVDAPDEYKNYSASSAKLYETLDKYPVIHISGHTHIPFRSDKNIYIGENHTAIQTPSITKGHQAYEGYIIEHYEGYTLMKGYNFLTEEYIPNAMFYIAEEYQCNPVKASTIHTGTSIYKSGSTSSTKGGATFGSTQVYDNRLIDYSKAVSKLTVPANNTYWGAISFKSMKLTVTSEYKNQLWNWRNNNGDIRFYVKNDADESLSFQLYLYGKSTNNAADGTDRYVQGKSKTIKLEANSGWVEVRLKYSDFTGVGNWGYIAKGNVNTFYVGLYNTSGLLKNTGGNIYISDIEFHDHTIESAITTDFDRPYEINTFVGEKDYSWKDDKTGNISRSFVDCKELPFITKATKITAAENYAFGNLASSTQIGLFYKEGNPSKVLALWAQNPDAELRFWIKTTQNTTFGITFQVGDKNAYNASVSVKGSNDWQQVVLKSSSFTNVSNIYNQATAMSARDTYLVLDVKSGTFVPNQQIMVGNRLEVFSHKAYAKGDANKDGVVDIRDLVKADNQMQTSATEFIPADIDNNGKLNSTDIGYIRKWLFDGKWK